MSLWDDLLLNSLNKGKELYEKATQPIEMVMSEDDFTEMLDKLAGIELQSCETIRRINQLRDYIMEKVDIRRAR